MARWKVARKQWSGTGRMMVMALAVGLGSVACGGSGADTQSASATVSAEVQADVMSRWNAVARGIVLSGGFDFAWSEYEMFPHPTFKGGSVEAYQTFCEILVLFYERDDNFDYLPRNGLFRAALRDRFATGEIGFETTFEKLTADMVTQNWFSPSDTTRQKLEQFAARIKMTP